MYPLANKISFLWISEKSGLLGASRETSKFHITLICLIVAAVTWLEFCRYGVKPKNQSLCIRKGWHRKDKQYITNTCVCVESSHYLAWFVVWLPNEIKTILHVFDPYVTFCLHCTEMFHVLKCPYSSHLQRSVAFRPAVYRCGEKGYLWINFSFNDAHL